LEQGAINLLYIVIHILRTAPVCYIINVGEDGVPLISCGPAIGDLDDLRGLGVTVLAKPNDLWVLVDDLRRHGIVRDNIECRLPGWIGRFSLN
jgi:hypothetical protein